MMKLTATREQPQRCGRADEEGKNIKKKKVGWNEILRVSE